MKTLSFFFPLPFSQPPLLALKIQNLSFSFIRIDSPSGVCDLRDIRKISPCPGIRLPLRGSDATKYSTIWDTKSGIS